MYGPACAGKTHLLQAACREASRQGRSSAYVPLSIFARQGAAILEGLNDVKLLALDDCDRVLDDRRWQQSLFGLINAVRNRRRCLLMAGRKNPATMGLALRDLQSRLVWGGVYAVHTLCDQDKMKVLVRLAADAGYRLNDDAAQYLFNTCPRDLSSLIASLKKLIDSGEPRKHTITAAISRRVLKKTQGQTGLDPQA